ncbi:hypothetical protein BDN71DRAFT_1386591 [Pleurotus eryngii]|uniref:Uncharacterized protein n=1 Tax=Pleurotus eryngii TaxID=5323 RepID=A0A9P6A694_PLEER|nr:hypothetical protein BDN71DRAFT_1386591 [Pleurotus eryngii]
MVFRRISEDIKLRALYLLSIGYLIEDVCDILGVSNSSIQRWKANQEQHGSVIPPPDVNQGRSHMLNTNMTHILVTPLKDASDMYLDEIQDWITATCNHTDRLYCLLELVLHISSACQI